MNKQVKATAELKRYLKEGGSLGSLAKSYSRNSVPPTPFPCNPRDVYVS